MTTARLGIDIGGTGIKAGVVDLEQGRLLGDRQTLATPRPAVPEAVASAVASLVAGFDYDGPVGIGFPAVVTDGRVWTANNIDSSWVGVDAVGLFRRATGREIAMVNDSDAAALCEARYGAAHGVPGVVLLLTFGTGIGAGLICDGRLVPNLQIGDIELDGFHPAETHFSGAAREKEGLSWAEWGRRVNRFVGHVKIVFSPTLIILGGGPIKNWDRWSESLDPDLGVVPATRANSAGIVGAATLVG